jgi:uracil-DNA glycosylase family 4
LRPNSIKMASVRGRVEACRKCPRLVRFRESIGVRASFSAERYWRKPVPGFGDIGGRLLVLGIAPAAHGGNRTGRPFTGDSSGRFLVHALHAAGFASQPTSEGWGDGLSYKDCYVTAAVKCAPPGDRPTPEEFSNCSVYLDEEIELLTNLEAVLALGVLSFKAYLDLVGRKETRPKGLKFAHGARYDVGGVKLYASYHPSPRNTNTGRLTPAMLLSLLRRVRSELGQSAEAGRIRSMRSPNV